MWFKTFGGSLAITAVGLTAAYIYAGPAGLALAAILGVLEFTLSFDNAVVNATVLRTMNAFWQKLFLTLGVVVAVVGMRLAFPLLVVGITAGLSPASAISLAMQRGDPHTEGSYGYLLHEAHPAIAAFGGVFLLMLFCDFVFERREITWMGWLERPLARIGQLDQLSIAVTLIVVSVAAVEFASESKSTTVLISGVLGLVTYVLVNALAARFDPERHSGRGTSAAVMKVGKAALMSFLYLEVLDASFSFDGVVGAFAITSDPIIIAIGLGLIGATFVRSLTVFLVRQRTLEEYIYLEHGAHWAIGALAVLLLCTIRFDIPELVTGSIGIGFIGLAFISSIVRNKRSAPSVAQGDSLETART
ncbi:hypothetical protein Lesp02_13450 [Lentzea sp. NBRC 105346]|uniref:DUF475 domain-containing protein n=1 Tax=Lentzea sp. NBRC 105346 TaxID=3032205 RepID=UPI0024A24644|nr:DUF475 domain-containing protein [Lentzea sp. NBRC 105346]GLZ29155.1 hypothetical protein Lesp02_13450 [Lentzea sp. NBRC 105346]